MGIKSGAAGAANAIMLAALILNPSPAYAYLDPGTGSVILQATIGAFVAIAVVAKLYWHRILRYWGISQKTGEQPVESRSDKDQQDA